MISIFLAHVIGWYFVVVGLLLLFRQEHVRTAMSNVLAQPGLFFVFALLTLIMGLLLVVSHNVWLLAWPVVITIIAWLVLIGSLLRLFFPNTALEMGQSFLNNPMRLTIAGITCLIVGLFLLINVFYLYFIVLPG